MWKQNPSRVTIQNEHAGLGRLPEPVAERLQLSNYVHELEIVSNHEPSQCHACRDSRTAALDTWVCVSRDSECA